MKLLLLLTLIALIAGDEDFIAERGAEDNDVSLQAGTFLQAQSSAQEVTGEKKLGKRSYGLFPASYGGSYGSVLPWYRLGGLSSYGLYGGWYPGWPLLYGGYGGWQGGWYKGW